MTSYSSTSSPGIPTIRVTSSAPDIEAMNARRHRIPDSIMETDEEYDEETADESGAEQETTKPRKKSSVLEDDVFVETEEEDNVKSDKHKDKDEMHSNAGKLKQFLEVRRY